MKYTLIFALILSALMFSCGSQPEEKPFDLKTLKDLPAADIVAPSDSDVYSFQTGVVIYKSEALGMEQNITVWFTDFGKTSLSEIVSSFMGQTTHQNSLVTDSMLYMFDLEAKSGSWERIIRDSSKAEINYRHLTDEIIKSRNIKEAGKENILGKECKVYTMIENVSEQPVQMKVWVWEGLILKSVSTIAGIEITMEAKDMRFNVVIPEGKFALPKGFDLKEKKITEMPDPS